MRFSLHLWGWMAAATLVTGCAMAPERGTGSKPGAKAPRPEQRCNATAAQWAIGKTNTEHNVNEARQRAGAYMVRVLRPGQPTTREFNAERLNLEVDATGRIIKSFCG